MIRGLVSGASRWPLLLWGPPGRGKSCAALCLLDHVIGDDPFRFAYQTAGGLALMLDDARRGRLVRRIDGEPSRSIEADLLWRWLEHLPLVVMDELGRRDKPSAPSVEAVQDLIDRRGIKPLVVISNLFIEDLGSIYGAPIASRLGSGTVFRLEGEDRRIKRGG